MKRTIFCVLVILVVGVVIACGLIAVPQEVSDNENSVKVKKGISNKCSISGRITDSNSGSPVPNVKIELFEGHKIVVTDGSGMYSFKNLEPGEYTLRFFPPHPFCCKRYERQCQKTFILKTGEKIIFDKALDIGGAISGKVYKSAGRPFSDVTIYVKSNNGSSFSGKTKEDGSYFIGSLFPAQDYFIAFHINISGYPNRLITRIEVEKGKCTAIEDVIFDFNDATGFEGCVTSSLDGSPLPNVRINVYYTYKKTDNVLIPFLCGSIETDSNGYFCMSGIERTGKYHLFVSPILPPPKHPKTGKPMYTKAEFVELGKRLTVNVKKGEKTKLFITLDIPSYAPLKKNKKKL